MFITSKAGQRLWEKVASTSIQAKRAGAIISIDTTQEFIKDHGIKFIVSVSKALNKKPIGDVTAPTKSEVKKNPFLPCEPDLFVQEINGTHNLVLNKFNVVENHVILATVDFQRQSEPLNEQDFAAAWHVMSGLNLLGFYNCGPLSGASQPHKHLQMIPLPLSAEIDCPIHPLILESAPTSPTQIFELRDLKFKHKCALLDQSNLKSDLEEGEEEKHTEILKNSAQYLEKIYNNLLESVKQDSEVQGQIELSYNFLMTNKWMMVVPRKAEKYGNIPVNSIGFCGAILVKNEEDLRTLKDVGPLRVLEHLAFTPKLVNNL